MVFDADPSPDAEITSEAIDPEVPLGVMDDEGNIVADLTDVSMAVDTSGQRATPKERMIDAGHVEKCVTDVRELVGNLFQAQAPVVIFVRRVRHMRLAWKRHRCYPRLNK